MAWLFVKAEVLKEPREFFYRNKSGEEQRGVNLWVQDLDNDRLKMPINWFNCGDDVREGCQYEFKCYVSKRKNPMSGAYEYSFNVEKAKLIRDPSRVKDGGDEIEIPF